MEEAVIAKHRNGPGSSLGPEQGAFAGFPTPERVRAVPSTPMGEAANMTQRDRSGSGTGPELGSVAAISGRGRVRADRPPRRGESGDRS